MSIFPSAQEPAASLTSYSQLFERKIEGQIIKQIEIPLIQRDYAQGRKTDSVNRIRVNFIDALCKALLPDTPAIDLDFVFGDVDSSAGNNQGKFYPLDGQQRLTTLFLIHCYLAWRNNVRGQDQLWSKFTYATRPGARDFCNFLVQCQPDFSAFPSEWIKDHANYLPTWQHDSSIQSMLVVLDALHEWFTAKQPDLQQAWDKLLNKENPAIRFHILPMKANGLTDELYIKMNSRGRPLTSYENFKAHFEDVLQKSHHEKVSDFARKVDTDWSDILWPYRGNDHLIDDEFMHYFRFITEVCAWKNEIVFKDTERDIELAEAVYGARAPNAAKNLETLFQAFDVWKGKNVKGEFENLLTAQRAGSSTALIVFRSFEKEGVDFFHACCRHYGTLRKWTLADTLMLYGVLLKFIHQVSEYDSSNRLRILRNLLEASTDEIRSGERNNMPKLLVEVEQIIVYGDMQRVSTFNQVQVKNEIAKAKVIKEMPMLESDLHRLEDHDLLRGGLTAFDLNPIQFQQRAQAFIKVFDKLSYPSTVQWKLLTSALLVKGNYSRWERRWTGHSSADFGSPRKDEPWQVLFRGRKGDLIHPTSKALSDLLDSVVTGSSLQDVIDAYLNDPNTPKDWRYYLVKYDDMREGASGHYTFSPSGYQVCMLEKERMSSDYYDPFLLAVVQQCGISQDRIGNKKWPRAFYGYETDPRLLMLKNSGLRIENVDEGWQLRKIPTDQVQKAAFDQVCSTHQIGLDLLCAVPKINGFDAEDRVELGVRLLNALADAGL